MSKLLRLNLHYRDHVLNFRSLPNHRHLRVRVVFSAKRHNWLSDSIASIVFFFFFCYPRLMAIVPTSQHHHRHRRRVSWRRDTVVRHGRHRAVFNLPRPKTSTTHVWWPPPRLFKRDRRRATAAAAKRLIDQAKNGHFFITWTWRQRRRIFFFGFATTLSICLRAYTVGFFWLGWFKTK